jgi:hypothetical protein
MIANLCKAQRSELTAAMMSAKTEEGTLDGLVPNKGIARERRSAYIMMVMRCRLEL